MCWVCWNEAAAGSPLAAASSYTGKWGGQQQPPGWPKHHLSRSRRPCSAALATVMSSNLQPWARSHLNTAWSACGAANPSTYHGGSSHTFRPARYAHCIALRWLPRAADWETDTHPRLDFGSRLCLVAHSRISIWAALSCTLAEAGDGHARILLRHTSANQYSDHRAYLLPHCHLQVVWCLQKGRCKINKPSSACINTLMVAHQHCATLQGAFTSQCMACCPRKRVSRDTPPKQVALHSPQKSDAAGSLCWAVLSSCSLSSSQASKGLTWPSKACAGMPDEPWLVLRIRSPSIATLC